MLERKTSTCVLFTGKPGKPEGPLEVSDITEDSCKLSWNPPKDTGGSPITNYIIEKMDMADGEWKPVTKFCRGDNYTVNDLVKGLSSASFIQLVGTGMIKLLFSFTPVLKLLITQDHHL